jgi:hypothetical protein
MGAGTAEAPTLIPAARAHDAHRRKSPAGRPGLTLNQSLASYFREANRFSISAQFTTFHQAATYSFRRFWYFR